MAILFHTPWANAADWLAGFRAALPEHEIRVWPETGKPEEVAFALLWQFPPGELGRFPRLRGIASLGAGVDRLLNDPSRPADVPVTRLADPLLADRMAEYVVAAVLHGHLDLDGYATQQRDALWQRRPYRDASRRPIGMLGLGLMGRRSAERLAAFRFPILGWSRRQQRIPGIDCRSGEDGLRAVLAAAEILVLQLPATRETNGLLSAARLALLPRGAVLINPARGELLDEAALLDALDSGRLAGATLDCFATEPLPKDSRLWRHPKVSITPHIASLSEPATGVALLAAECRRCLAGEPMLHRVDAAAGY
ncbi:MAG: glyoxylate/hydroxypyruvate reductase A [Alphaproteobacteria bacterium]|nr:glyoxylate/hydroxypyruvate reductase A [Alphaproteobacteria bacterium]